MPLPRFDPEDAQTASWGGTMIGIPRKCKDPDKAWRLIEALYLDHDSIIFRRRMNAILPPITAYWNDPVYSEPDPYFAGQRRDELFIRLARDMPPRYVTPFTTVAIGLLSDVLNKATARIDRGETDGLERDIRLWLKDAHDDLARRIEFGTFD
jgi:hypothetical protein